MLTMHAVVNEEIDLAESGEQFGQVSASSSAKCRRLEPLIYVQRSA
jgi:hypothetical protein